MSLNDVEIMPCRNEFLPQLTELWKEYMVDQGEDPLLPYLDLEASKEGFRKILVSHLEREPEGFLVALLSSEVVGFAVSFKNALGPNYVTKKGIGLLQFVHVKRGYRRSGIATQLVNVAFSYLVANGCSIVLAETGEKNTRSMQMLEKLGFRQRGKLVTFIKDI